MSNFSTPDAVNSAVPPEAADGNGAGHTTATLSGLERKKRPLGGAATVFILLGLLALAVVETLSRVSAWDNQLAESRTATVNIAQATAEHAEKTIDLIGSMLFGLVEQVEQNGVAPDKLPIWQQNLMARVKQTPALQALILYDEGGRWLVTSVKPFNAAVNNSDRAYFAYHRTHRDRGLYIGAPIQSRSSGVWVLPLSRRIEHADGSFAGVALATVRIDYFQKYYDRFDIGKNGAIFLALADGTLVTRRPFLPEAIGTSIKNGPVFAMAKGNADSGTAMRVSRLDGVERLYTYRRSSAHPIFIAAALSKTEIFSGWWTITFTEVGGLLLVLFILFFLGYRLFMQIRIRARLETELWGARNDLRSTNALLEELAATDPLTGLKNRRYMSERMDHEFSRAARLGASLAIIMIDIDFFKRFNDTYGHLAGDACLKMVSGVIARTGNRTGDVTARMGGEEFALMLPNTDMEGAVAVGNKICQAVFAIRESHISSDIGVVTISVGVFAGVPMKSGSVVEYMGAADTALYKAKLGGRNQVAVGHSFSRCGGEA